MSLGFFCPQLSALLISPWLHSWLGGGPIAVLFATPVQSEHLYLPLLACSVAGVGGRGGRWGSGGLALREEGEEEVPGK